MRIAIVFYSMYGHIYRMAQAVAEGARAEGAEVDLLRVPETLPDELVEQLGGKQFQDSIQDVPIADPSKLPQYDAVIVGTPTRFGNMCAQMRAFWDSTGAQWAGGELVGKVGSVFTSSATQHGGQETTITATQTTLLHHGMVIVGLPYAFQGQMRLDEITGGSPYGASTITGGQGERMPSGNELESARFQGRHVASIARKLAGVPQYA